MLGADDRLSAQGKYRLIATKVRLDEDVNVKEPDEGFVFSERVLVGNTN